MIVQVAAAALPRLPLKRSGHLNAATASIVRSLASVSAVLVPKVKHPTHLHIANSVHFTAAVKPVGGLGVLPLPTVTVTDLLADPALLVAVSV